MFLGYILKWSAQEIQSTRQVGHEAAKHVVLVHRNNDYIERLGTFTRTGNGT